MSVMDREFTAPGVDAAPTGLDALRAVAERKVTRPPVTLNVPERPGWKLRFDANISDDRRQSWMASATDSTGRLQGLALALTALAEKHLAIIDPDGQEVTEDGAALTFRSQQVMDMFAAATPMDAVRAFFGVDPHCDDASSKLFEAAGFYDEVTVDPTPGSSTSS